MSNILRRTTDTPDSFNLQPSGRNTLYDKIYHGFVKDTNDLQRMGRLKVWIPELGGDPNESNNWISVLYASPFAGATSFYKNKNGSSYLDTQTSYGMWFVPPDVDNEVIVAFINGDPAKGVWLGCLYQQLMNHMVPGIPGNNSTATQPVAEYNKKITQANYQSPNRPIYTPLSDQLDKQGLSKDPVRGPTTSGARRDDPANEVYGILTPGGNQFVFDDNPQNKYIRLRTQSGAQLLINDSTGCIYLNTVDGKNWVSMDATGKIDIFAVDDITVRSQGSVNIRGDLDVNIEAGRDINMRARGTPPTTEVVNTSNPPIPPVPATGAISVIGDSIAVGVGAKIDQSFVFANVGDSSSTILDKINASGQVGNSVNTIMSVGSNDSNQTLLASNLVKIRKALGTSNFIWLLPYADATNNTVKLFATGNGDKYLDLKSYPSGDNIHPKDYAVVANDARALCVNAPESAGPTGPSTGATGATGTTGTAGTTGSTGPASNLTFDAVATQFIQSEEGGYQSKAYPDPGPTWYSIGFGHSIGGNELQTGKTSINCGSAGIVPLVGQYGKDTTMTRPQADALFAIDLRTAAADCRRQLGGAWDSFNVYQQVAVADLAYNVGPSWKELNAGNKFTDYFAQNNIKAAADLIRNFKTKANLANRRAKEAAYFEGHPELAAAGNSVPDGYPVGSSPGPGGVGPLSPISGTQGGYVRIQAKNEMHLLSDSNMFITSKVDMHRVVGGNLFDTVLGGTSRVTAGSVIESIGGGLAIGVQAQINIDGARIDMNGAAPPAAIPGASAVGPREQKQTDSILNTIGNATPIITDTILPHLPYHEPYFNHGGRNFQNIRNSTNIDKNTGLRDGEVIKNSTKPLDVYGIPKSNMTQGFYTGAQYNTQNSPIYNYQGSIANYTFSSASSLQLSANGRSFITSRENGSYRTMVVGNPQYNEIGYGHTLTPEELSSGSITINGLPVSLNQPITQQQINDLFDQDMTKVLDWMRPLIKVPVTQTQFDMLASLAWNIGQSNFTGSDVLKYINNNTLQKVPNNWMVWTVDGGNEVISGLVQRRIAEATNFMLGPSYDFPPGNSVSVP